MIISQILEILLILSGIAVLTYPSSILVEHFLRRWNQHKG